MIAGTETTDDALHNMSAPPRMQLTVRPLRSMGSCCSGIRSTLLGILDLEVLGGLGGGSTRPLEALARLALKASAEGSPENLEGFLDEDLGDLIVRVGAGLDPLSLGLPPFAVFRPVKLSGHGPSINDPSVAVALATRMSGRLFIARRAPHVPDIRKIAHPLAVHTMGRQ
jgi:hypothetical protein